MWNSWLLCFGSWLLSVRSQRNRIAFGLLSSMSSNGGRLIKLPQLPSAVSELVSLLKLHHQLDFVPYGIHSYAIMFKTCCLLPFGTGVGLKRSSHLISRQVSLHLSDSQRGITMSPLRLSLVVIGGGKTSMVSVRLSQLKLGCLTLDICPR